MASRPRRRRRDGRLRRGPRATRRVRLNLRTKLLLFAIAIAIVPLLVAGRTMIRIAQDELKSSANEQLVNTANQIVREINDLYERTWLAPLVLIRNAIDDPVLGVAGEDRAAHAGHRQHPRHRRAADHGRGREPCPWSWSRTSSPPDLKAAWPRPGRSPAGAGRPWSGCCARRRPAPTSRMSVTCRRPTTGWRPSSCR